MNGFLQSAFQVFFVFAYLLLYVVSVIILQPFRIHHKRPLSTILIKVSYLIFLAVFLIFTYLLLFGTKQLKSEDVPFDTLFNIHFIFFASSILIPNLGIMFRRRIKKRRVAYNLLVSFLNFLYITYLIFAISTGKWALL
jgi:hypothetical protein